MGELKTSVIIDLKGNLDRQSKRFAKSIQRFSKQGGRALKHLGKRIKATGKLYGKMGKKMFGNRLGAAGAAAAALGTGRHLLGLEERYERLGVQADISPDQAKALRRKVFATSQQSDIKVNPSEILSAIEKVVEKTGDLQLAEKNIRNIGLAIQATGARGEDIGALVADLMEKFHVKKANAILGSLDDLAIQGKAGAFELKNLATQGERVTAAYAATGRTGRIAVREMNAILQMTKRGTGSAEEAATAFERLLGTITQEKSKELQKRGIKIWDEKELAKGNKMARAVPDIIKDIIRKTGGDTEKLAQVFDIRALRALIPYAIEFKRTGGFASADNFLNVRGTGKVLTKDSARIARTGNAAINQAKSNTIDSIDSFILWNAKELPKLLDSLNPLTLSRSNKWLRDNAHRQQAPGSQPEAKVKVEFESKDGSKVRVKSIQATGLELEVDSGNERTMAQ